jgi:hypothetical protein
MELRSEQFAVGSWQLAVRSEQDAGASEQSWVTNFAFRARSLWNAPQTAYREPPTTEDEVRGALWA